MTYQRKKFLVWLMLTLMCMGFIFYKSSQPYSQQDLRPSLAAYIPDKLVQSLPNVDFRYSGQLVTTSLPYDFIEFFIRKGAHVGVFAVLTFLAIQTLLALKWKYPKAIVTGSIVALLYAMSDEWHQSFVANRTGHAIDVGVDSIGIALVILGYIVALTISHIKKRRFQPYSRF